MISIGADILQSSSVAVVGVDADDFAAIVGRSAFDIDVSLALRAAVTARSVDLAVVFGVEVDNVDSTTAVMLDNLVRGMVRATTNDPRLLSLLVVFLWIGVSEGWIYSNRDVKLTMVMASSQTSSNQTNLKVQGPLQCTPSCWFLPMMTF